MTNLDTAANDPVCSVCEGHETDHAGCANAVQHFLRQCEERAQAKDQWIAALETFVQDFSDGNLDATIARKIARTLAASSAAETRQT
jgi:hypothetical protein